MTLRGYTCLQVGTLNDRHIHVVCGRTDILVLLASENVQADHVDLGVTVLAGLGGRHLHDLAGAALQKHTRIKTY